MAKDLSDQKPGNFILIVGSEHPQYYYVNEFQQFEDTMRFFDREGDLVYMCRVEAGSWAVVSTHVTGTISEADMVRFTKEEHSAEREFIKNLDPEAYRKAEEMFASGRVGMTEEGQVVMLPEGAAKPKRTPEEEAALKTGQYI